jgi:uncharacterized protein YjbI with pentapeptide repeats
MNPQVEAAFIAGAVSLISLGGTVFVAAIGIRATRKVAGTTLDEQHIRTLNERFSTAAEKLGGDRPPAVRLAGVHAMAGLADDWEDNRQACIDVLCAYLRLRYPREPGPGEKAQLAFQADREVRHTVIRVIAAHLRDGAKVSWQRRDFDFTGVVFDGGSFDRAVFSSGTVSFNEAKFPGGEVSFRHTKFSGAQVGFRSAEFSGGRVIFREAEFSRGAELRPGRVSFREAEFSRSEVGFPDAKFSGGEVSFHRVTFSHGEVSFSGAKFSSSDISFRFAEFSGGRVSFSDANFSGGIVRFREAKFSRSEVGFPDAKFSGAQVDLGDAEFSGGQVDFSNVAAWKHPPKFDWDSTPPSGVKLPVPPGAWS